ncbi:MAG: hypothetical protein AB1861_13230 [Cyanobacteriota bacterium]
MRPPRLFNHFVERAIAPLKDWSDFAWARSRRIILNTVDEHL